MFRGNPAPLGSFFAGSQLSGQGAFPPPAHDLPLGSF